MLEEADALRRASNAAREIAEALDEALGRAGIPHTINRVESMFQVFFVEGEVDSPERARRSDRRLYVRLHEELLRRGVFIAPSQFEAVFTASVHDDPEVLERVRTAIEGAVRALRP